MHSLTTGWFQGAQLERPLSAAIPVRPLPTCFRPHQFREINTVCIAQTLGLCPRPRTRREAAVVGLRTQPTPAANSVGRFVGIKGSLRRVLTRSVLACGCAPHAACAPALDPASAQHVHSKPTIRRSAARGRMSASAITSAPPTNTTSRWARVTAVYSQLGSTTRDL